MSSIDQRIVSMQFDNAKFQDGVRSTIDSMKNLTKSLASDVPAKGLSKLGEGVDLLKEKFNALNIIGFGALASIGAKAASVGMDLASKFFIDPAKSGLQEYEMKMGAIQTMLANTSKFGTSLEDVTAELDKLNEYSDKTIYNFGDMIKNVALFTNAGMRIEEATSVIKGFSNEAAVSGVTADKAAGAAYQLSQALSAGLIRLIDWKSLTNAGMGNKNMQAGLIEIAEAMGTLTKNSDIAKQAASDFGGTLEKGWLTAEVMTNYLKIQAGDLTDAQMKNLKLTDAQIKKFKDQQKRAEESATMVRTMTQLFGTLGEQVGSGWAQTMELVIGNFNEATAMFTQLSDYLGKFVTMSSDARNEQLKIWKDLGGRQALINGFANIFRALGKIVGPIAKVLHEMFPPTWGKTLADFSKGFEKLTKGLIISDKASEAIGKAFRVLFSIVKVGKAVLGGLVTYLLDTVSMTVRLGAAVLGLLSPIGTWIANFLAAKLAFVDVGAAIEWLWDKINKFRNISFDNLIAFLDQVGTALNDLLNGDYSKGAAFFQGVFQKMMAPLENVGKVVSETWDRVMGALPKDASFLSRALQPLIAFGEIFKRGWSSTMAWFNKTFTGSAKKVGGTWDGITSNIRSSWEGVVKFFQGIWAAVEPVVKQIMDVVGVIGTKLGDMFKNMTPTQVAAGVNLGGLIAAFVALGQVIKPLMSFASGAGGFFSNISETISSVADAIANMQKQSQPRLMLAIAVSIGILALSFAALAKVNPAQLLPAAAAMVLIMTMLHTSLKGFAKVATGPELAKMPAIAAGLVVFAGAVALLALSVSILGNMSWEQLTKGMIGLLLIMGGVAAAALMLDKVEKSLIKASFGLTLMAGAISLLIPPLVLLGSLPWPVVQQGLVALGLMLAGIVAAALLLGLVNNTMILAAAGLVAIAFALNLLLIPLLTLGYLPWQVLQQGLTVLGILLVGLVGTALLLGAVGPTMLLAALGLTAISLAIMLLVPSVIALGAVDYATLSQGLQMLAIALGILVAAGVLMTAGAVGALGMLAMATAVLILTGAMAALAAIGPEGIGRALQAFGIMVAGMAAAALLLTPVAPLFLVVGAAMGVLGIGLAVISGAMLVFTIALVALSPALAIASAALLAFAAVAPQIAITIPIFVALGVALIAFGAGAAVTAIGVGALGLALMALGVGLGMVAAVGLLGAEVLKSIIPTITELLYHVPGMLGVAGAFALLGAGLLALGVGMGVFAIGAALVVVAIAMMVPLLAILPPLLQLMISQFERLPAIVPGIEQCGNALQTLGEKLRTVGEGSSSAISGLQSMTSTIGSMTSKFRMLGVIVMVMSTMFRAAFMMVQVIMTMSATIMESKTNQMDRTMRTFDQRLRGAMISISLTLMMGGRSIESQLKAIAKSFDILPRGIASTIPAVNLALGTLLSAMRNRIHSSISGMGSEMKAASTIIGAMIIQGMVNGLQNGSGLVAASARNVATKALAAAKATLAVASPSKKFEELFYWAAMGAKKGLDDNSDAVANASGRMGKGAIDAMKTAIAGLGATLDSEMDLNPKITPVLDMSNIRAGDIARAFGNPSLNVGGVADLVRKSEPISSGGNSGETISVGAGNKTYYQTIISPRPLSRSEIYRQSNNLFKKV